MNVFILLFEYAKEDFIFYTMFFFFKVFTQVQTGFKKESTVLCNICSS